MEQEPSVTSDESVHSHSSDLIYRLFNLEMRQEGEGHFESCCVDVLCTYIHGVSISHFKKIYCLQPIMNLYKSGPRLVPHFEGSIVQGDIQTPFHSDWVTSL